MMAITELHFIGMANAIPNPAGNREISSANPFSFSRKRGDVPGSMRKAVPTSAAAYISTYIMAMYFLFIF